MVSSGIFSRLVSSLGGDYINMSVVAVTLQAVQPQDYKRLAYLEATAFGDDEFTQVAFGSQRFDDKVQEARGKEMSNWTNKPGEVVKYVKAVRTAADGTERIVGFAHWVTVRPSLGGVGVYGAGKEEEEKFKKDSKEDIKLGEEARGKVETVINEKLCHDLFVPGDQYMAKACEGKDYHSKCTTCCFLDVSTNSGRTVQSDGRQRLPKTGYRFTTVEGRT